MKTCVWFENTFLVAPALAELLIFSLWCLFACGHIDILGKKLTPGDSVLALKILFLILVIFCLGLKDTLQEVL